MTPQWQPSNPKGLAKQFSRLGWLGFWIQFAMLAIPVLLLTYVLFFSDPESAQRKGIDLSNYLSIGSLAVMVFTTFWFFRYTRLAKRIADPELCPPQSSVMRTLWIGLGASSLGILFSMLLLMSAIGRMLFILMATPQTGIPLAQPGGDPATTLAAVDAVSMTSLLVMHAAELIVLAFSLWLLFRVATRPAAEIVEDAEQDLDAHAE